MSGSPCWQCEGSDNNGHRPLLAGGSSKNNDSIDAQWTEIHIRAEGASSYDGLATANGVTYVCMSIHPGGQSCSIVRSGRCSQ